MVNKIQQNNRPQKEITKPSGNISRSSSSSSSSKSSSSKPALSNRMCAQCQNHGLKIPVRGHKRFCKFRLCNCQNCLLVKERQRIVALHLYVRRAQQQEEDAAEAAKAALGRATALAHHHQPATLESFAPVLPRPAFLMPNFHQLHAHSSGGAAVDAAYLKADAEEQRKNLLYSSLLELRSHHPVPDAALPLLLCILNISNSVKEASEKIQKGLQELSSTAASTKEVGSSAFNLHQPYYL